MSTIKVNNISSRTGNAISFTSGDTITIPSGATFTNNGTINGLGANIPSFAAEQSGSQSISNDANVKLQCDTENWDTDSAYDNSTNYRFTVPSGKGGKYYIQAHVQIPGIDANEFGQIFINKNGTTIEQSRVREQKASADRIFQMITAITYSLSVGDYIEVYVYQNSGDAQSATNGYFTAHRLIGV